MFKIYRQGETALKKCLTKFFDPKKDVTAKLKHLKYIKDNSSENEIHTFFKTNYSLIFYVLFDNFLLIEASLRAKGFHRSQKEELDGIISLFKSILIYLPHLIHKRWQYRGIFTILRKLLHPKNAFKIQREGVFLCMLWLSALRGNAYPSAIFLYKCLVPEIGDGKKKRDLTFLFQSNKHDNFRVHPASLHRSVIPQRSDNHPRNTTKYFLDSILESMVLKVNVLEWNDKEVMSKKVLAYLWDLFAEHYIKKAFPDLNFATNIFATYSDITLSEKSLDVLTTAVPVNSSFIAAKVSIIKWIVTFISPVMKPTRKSSEKDSKMVGVLLHRSSLRKSSANQDDIISVTSANALSASSSMSGQSIDFYESPSPNAYSNGIEKAASATSLCSLDYKLDSCTQDQVQMVKSVLFSTRRNINLVHEVFRQSFMLPMSQVSVIKRVIRLYRIWIQSKDPPIFMLNPNLVLQNPEHAWVVETNLISNSLQSADDDVPYISRQRDSGTDIQSTETSVYAGPESTYQLFITSSAFAFVSTASNKDEKLLPTQLDVCRRILTVYRYMIVNAYLSDETWVHFLRVLLYITQRILDQAPTERSERADSFAGKIAGPVFQTLIVSWIKANLCVTISRKLWDDLVDLFSSHCDWEELIVEWSKNMETLTKVLSRYVYHLELSDLPLDRLTEQQVKRQRKDTLKSVASSSKHRRSSLYEQAFQRGLRRRSSGTTIWDGTKLNKSRTGSLDTDSKGQSSDPEGLSFVANSGAADSEESVKSSLLLAAESSSEKSLDETKMKLPDNFPPLSDGWISSQLASDQEREDLAYENVEDLIGEKRGSISSNTMDDFDALVTERLNPIAAKDSADLISLDSQDYASFEKEWNMWLDSEYSHKQPFVFSADAGGTSPDSRETNSSTNLPLPYQLYQSRPSGSKDPSTVDSDQAISFHYQSTKDEISFSSTDISSASPISSGRKSDNRFSPTLASEMDAILPEFQEGDEPHEQFAFSPTLDPKTLLSKPISTPRNSSVGTPGVQSGWSAEVAVVLWRRLLGVFGDVNQIADGKIHALLFQYLMELSNILFKMRQNIGIAIATGATPVTAQTAAEEEELVPPLQMLSPWAFKAAMSQSDSHKDGKLHAFQILCQATIQRDHDIPLNREHLAQFYAVLHETLHSKDQVVVNKVVENCSDYFSCSLPACTLLLPDFFQACRSVCLSPIVQAPRVKALTIFGSTLLFSNIYNSLPVIKSDSPAPLLETKQNLRDDIVDLLLLLSRIEQNPDARCLALSCSGLWLYDELSSDRLPKHPLTVDLVNILLATLKVQNCTVANAASCQLRLLSNCSKNILNALPELPLKIIEIYALSLWGLLHDNDARKTEPGRQLIICHLISLLEWCMVVPLSLLTSTLATKSDKPLIRRVFKAIQCATAPKLPQSRDGGVEALDSNFPLEQLLDAVPSASSLGATSNKSKTNKKTDSNSIIRLTANVVIKHLVNYLGHFPLARGSSVLASLVSENHDISLQGLNELTPAHFNSPEVQFFVYNDTCLLSVVEIPAEENKPGGGPTAGMTTSDRCVRFIVRDVGGKYCWESSVLHGPPDVEEMNAPVVCRPAASRDAFLCNTKRTGRDYIQYAEAQKKTKQSVEDAPLPHYDEGEPAKLDQLLQHLGSSSTECQTQTGLPLNIPPPLPPCVSQKLENDVMQHIFSHHEKMNKFVSENVCNAARYEVTNKTQPPPPVNIHAKFYHARLLCSELAFLSRDSRRQIYLLQKSERLLRELKNLDAGNCRETHKVAVFYIAEGQEDKVSILSNAAGSKEYEDFVSGLGWEVDLSKHCGFRGKLQSTGSTGDSCPYYATSTLEVIFHVATRFPSNSESARDIKIRHLGNDEVHIVWSEHYRDYRRGIIPTEFADVLIVIYPIKNGLYKIQIMKKDKTRIKFIYKTVSLLDVQHYRLTIPYFGPLFDGAIVNARVLPVLVRETAVNAGRAKRSMISLFQSYYEERTRYLQQIITQYKDRMTFEEYCSCVFSPALGRSRHRRVSKTSKRTNQNNSNNLLTHAPVQISTSLPASPISLAQPLPPTMEPSKHPQFLDESITIQPIPPQRKKSFSVPRNPLAQSLSIGSENITSPQLNALPNASSKSDQYLNVHVSSGQ